MVPPATLLIGFIALGEVPSFVQLAGLAVIAIGFRFTLKP
jgi:drug/metabolite transporter (DMT)-like permease